MEPKLGLLLRLVKKSSSIEALLNQGLDYSQIFDLIGIAISLSYLKESTEGLTLTFEGNQFLQTNGPMSKPRTDAGWIEPANDFRIDKIKVDETYIPKEFTFD
ncbi:hypothetical protein [Maridesulfovibrio ferrireducens]|uniref:hypothetical protein n=1 Tax=Maridesulfovibrio ferrireducens TaxID=246191 RepID=UPI001A2617F2|nr:hypothetical protein [Maridesulfovibrio ferrireducens]MBI9110128.1 hypothetical protein [Maridesulfovibrio ferrireducens]